MIELNILTVGQTSSDLFFDKNLCVQAALNSWHFFPFSTSAARKKLEQVENGGCDRDASSMGSRSSSSGTTAGFG